MTPKRSKQPFTVLIMALILFSCSTKTIESNPEETLIRAARNASNEAIAKKDAGAVSSIWTTDYHVITSRNSEMSGREANRVRFANEFVSKPDVLYVRTPETIQVFSQWNMAAESGKWIGHWTEKGQLIEITGTYFAKWHKIGDRWQIRAEVFVPLTCSGGPYCDDSPI